MDAVHKGDRSLEPGSVPWKRRTSLGLGNFTGGETPCHLPRLLYSPGLMRGATRLGCGGFPALSHSCCHPHAHQRLSGLLPGALRQAPPGAAWGLRPGARGIPGHFRPQLRDGRPPTHGHAGSQVALGPASGSAPPRCAHTPLSLLDSIT